MAKGIDISNYRGLKVRRGHKAVLHLSEYKDGEERKIHLRFGWPDWLKFMKDVSEPITDWHHPAEDHQGIRRKL
jgi:hypothetical protein